MKIFILLGTLMLASSLWAGPGHKGHSHDAPAVSKEKIKKLGLKHVKRLAKIEKIDASWKKASFDKAIKKKYGKRMEWVVSFSNPKGVKGKKLFIFLKTSGKFVAANFTGK